MGVARYSFAVVVSSALLVGLTTVAQAEGPAVSALNGKLSSEGGTIGSNGNTSAIGLAEGSITAPLGTSFGIQADVAAGVAYNSFLAGGGLHAFWRDPSIGLFGPIAAMGGGRGSRIGLYGAEGEFYLGHVTLGGTAGYQDAVSSGTGIVPSGGFYTVHLTFYPIDDLALTAEGRDMAGQYTGHGTIEYQPDFAAKRVMSFFVDAEAGDSSYYRVTGGVRFYFGADKTLIRRHREDDPPQIPLGTLVPTGVGGPASSSPSSSGLVNPADGGSAGGVSGSGTITNSGGTSPPPGSGIVSVPSI